MTLLAKVFAFGLAAAVWTGALAQAAHMTQYASNPVEHDDQGRSNEPDGHLGGLYDAPVADCTLDLTGDGRCTVADVAAWPRGSVLAQGCTGDGGRRPSGACGLHTIGLGVGHLAEAVPPGLAGERGVTGPCPFRAGGEAALMLDVQQHTFAATFLVDGTGHLIVEVNRKLQDAGYFAAERGLGLGDGSDQVAGPVAMMAWHGYFRDKNCNGVIDQFGGTEADARNEFTWVGDCLPFLGQQKVVPEDVCITRDITFLGWEVPGNHHAHPSGPGACVEGTCYPLLADGPGTLVLCGLLAATLEGCDEEWGWGDPIFGDPSSSAPDWYFYDYTGDPRLNTRTYVAAPNAQMYHFDPSLIATALVFAAVDPPQALEGTYDLTRARFVDVDVLKTRSPALEAYLQTLVKPTLRGAWLTLREALP